MIKTTIELEREDWKLGYGKLFWMDKYNSANAILDKILEWTKDKKVKVYSHVSRVEYQFPDGSFYTPETPGIVGGNGEKCERIRFLDIYYQEN